MVDLTLMAGSFDDHSRPSYPRKRAPLRSDTAMFIGAVIRHLEHMRRLAANGERELGCPVVMAEQLHLAVQDLALEYINLQTEFNRPAAPSDDSE
jgi:hypothetical protein